MTYLIKLLIYTPIWTMGLVIAIVLGVVWGLLSLPELIFGFRKYPLITQIKT